MVIGRASIPPAGPLRRLAIGTLVSAVGNGAWFTSWAIFLTRSIGLTPAEVGIGMTIAGACGVIAATPLGWLGDRVGPRELFAVQLGLQALAGTAWLLVHGFAAFVAVAALAEIASSGSGGPRSALVLALSPAEAQFEALGALRSISHVGWAIGAVAGGAVITIGSRTGFVAMILLNAGSYAAYALIVWSVPRVGRRRAATGAQAIRVVRDAPYVSLAGLMGVLALCWAMLSSGLPLWVALHTHAPRAISAVVVLISCLGIAAFQVPVSRSIRDPHGAARGAVLSGCALAGSCLLFASTGGDGGWTVIAVILLATGLHIAGELLFVAASWGLSVPLMPTDAPSEYQGAFATGEAAALMIAPVLMTTLIAGWGEPGWFVLAAIFLVPAAASVPMTRWALRDRARLAER